MEIQESYELPKNATEEKLVKIWQEVLGIDRIGTTTNFFELGGHSLALARVHVLLQERLAEGLGLADVALYLVDRDRLIYAGRNAERRVEAVPQLLTPAEEVGGLLGAILVVNVVRPKWDLTDPDLRTFGDELIELGLVLILLMKLFEICRRHYHAQRLGCRNLLKEVSRRPIKAITGVKPPEFAAPEVPVHLCDPNGVRRTTSTSR